MEEAKKREKTKKENRYTAYEFIKYLERNNILLVNGDDIGEVELPEIDVNFIYDDDRDDVINF